MHRMLPYKEKAVSTNLHERNGSRRAASMYKSAVKQTDFADDSFETKHAEFPPDLEASDVPFSVQQKVEPAKHGRHKKKPNIISPSKVPYLDFRFTTQRARTSVLASEAGPCDTSGAQNIMVHYNDRLPSGMSNLSDSDPELEFQKEKLDAVMTGVASKLEAVLQSQNVMQPPRETGKEEFHRGKMTRSGAEFGGEPIVKAEKTEEKTPPAPAFDPNDTSAGIPQPPTAAGPMPVHASRVKRVATLKIK